MSRLVMMPHLLRRGVGDAAAEAQIRATLGGLGVNRTSVENAVVAYTGLSQGASASLLSIIHGGPVNATTLSPLVAAGLLALNASPPLVAAVAAALPILDLLTSFFTPSQPNCDWNVGSLCFTGIRPYGPGDSAWKTFEPWATANGGAHGLANLAFPGFYQLACDLGSMDPGAVGGTQQIQQFFQAYYAAWKANAEFFINGYTGVDPCTLLGAVAGAWNNAHAPSSTAQLSPTPLWVPATLFDLSRIPQCSGGFMSGPTYVGGVLNGDVNGTRCPPPTLNIGAEIVVPPLRIRGFPTKTTATPPSTLTKVVTGAAVAAGAAAAGIGLFALVKGWAFSRAFSHVWDKTGGRVTKAVRRGL